MKQEVDKPDPMQDGPFQHSTHHPESSARREPFLYHHCKDYTLGAMAIVLGIGMALAAVIAITIALTFFSLLPAPWVFPAAAIAWGVSTLWFWISLICIGRKDRKSRVSDAEIVALQIVGFAGGLPGLFSASADAHFYRVFGLLLEWCSLGFHLLYFFLALCVWVRLPLRAYTGFALLVPLTIWQTMNI